MVLVSMLAGALVAELYHLVRGLEVARRIALLVTMLVALSRFLTYATYAAAEIEPELFGGAPVRHRGASAAVRHPVFASALTIASACARSHPRSVTKRGGRKTAPLAIRRALHRASQRARLRGGRTGLAACVAAASDLAPRRAHRPGSFHARRVRLNPYG